MPRRPALVPVSNVLVARAATNGANVDCKIFDVISRLTYAACDYSTSGAYRLLTL